MTFRILTAQIKPKKGDYRHNLCKIGDVISQAASMESPPDVIVFPETVLSGYFLEGGVREVAKTREELFKDIERVYLDATPGETGKLDLITGFYELDDGKYYNSAMYLSLGKGKTGENQSGIVHVHRKFFLPTYGVFDEKRFVARGRTIRTFETRFGRVAVLICEDVWHSITASIAALKGAQIIYILSASPGREFSGEQVGNIAKWAKLLPAIAEEHSVFVVYSGLVGFEGGKGFTGSSCIIDPWGKTIAIGPAMDECLVVADIDLDDVAIVRAGSPLLTDLEANVGDLAMEMDFIARGPHRI